MNFKAARQSMVDCQLATNSVVSEKILEVIAKIPREKFLPEHKKQVAYLDEDILIGEGRYLMEPMIFARLLQAAHLMPTDVVLDVGGGSGYGAAVMSTMAATIILLEPVSVLRQYALKITNDLEMNNIADVECEGLVTPHEQGPYDVIFINGAVSELPLFLIEQLKEETGRLICVKRPNAQGNGKAILVSREKNGHLSITTLFDANIPYLTEFSPKNAFDF